MSLEPQRLEDLVSGETGFAFEAGTGTDADAQRWYLLRPRALPADHTFAIRATLGWRRLNIAFEPGKFAGGLLEDMSEADPTGRSAFRAVLADCQTRGAEVKLQINGASRPFDDDALWSQGWNRFGLTLNKGQLDLGTDDGEADADIVCQWTGRFAAAIVAILPLEEEVDVREDDIRGFPEGALSTVLVNRYERDRRNRAAAISIHGTSCKACGMDMGQRYGEVAAGFIHIHHTKPVSQIGPGYLIDPARDLVPLCPNCHGIAHRRSPPFTVEEISLMLG